MTPEDFKRNADTVVSAYKKLFLFRLFVGLAVGIGLYLAVFAVLYFFGPLGE